MGGCESGPPGKSKAAKGSLEILVRTPLGPSATRGF